jgi:hypothetical protein
VVGFRSQRTILLGVWGGVGEIGEWGDVREGKRLHRQKPHSLQWIALRFVKNNKESNVTLCQTCNRGVIVSQKGEGKFVPVLLIIWIRCMGEWTCSSTILDLVTRWKWVINFTLRLLYPREKAAGNHWIGGQVNSEPVWTLSRREKYLILAGNQTPTTHPAAVPIPTELSRLLDISGSDNKIWKQAVVSRQWSWEFNVHHFQNLSDLSALLSEYKLSRVHNRT